MEGPPKPPRVPSWVDRVQRIGAIELFEKYRKRLVHEETGLPFPPTRKASAYTIERLAFDTGKTLRMALRLFMPGCGLLFLLSFAWDWHGVIRSCAVAGVIGFATNWVAIKMLFWPREARPVFGHGLIPSQRDQLIDKVATEVLKNLINEDLILEKIEQTRIVQRFSKALVEKLYAVVADPEFKKDLRNLILTYVAELARNPEFRQRVTARVEGALEEFAGKRFQAWLVRRLRELWRGPVVEMLNQELQTLDQTVDEGLVEVDGLLERLPVAIEERQEAVDQVLTTMLVGLVREVDVREIVYEQLSTVTTEQLENGFLEFSDDKLSFITLLGGILGFLGGTIIVWPVPSILAMAGAFALLLALDLALQPLTKSKYWPKRS